MENIEKQIRVGNIFQFIGEWSYKHKKDDVFIWSLKDWYAIGESTLSLEEIKPMAITEDILLRLNLTRKYYKSKVVWVTSFKMFNYFDFYFELKEDGILVLNTFNFILKEFKYIHQLQNFYFDLTGDNLDMFIKKNKIKDD